MEVEIMSDIRILDKDPTYEAELARRKYGSCKFLAKVSFIIFLIVLSFGIYLKSNIVMALSSLPMIFSIYKYIIAAYTKSTYHL
jgi:hypothetical protein